VAYILPKNTREEGIFMMRWSPLDEIATMRESMDRLFEDHFSRRPRNGGAVVWQPAIDMSETESEVLVRVELPGVDPKNVDVSVTADTLAIRGQAQAEQETRDKSYYRRELRYGTFQRTLGLPTEMAGEQAKATFKHGILEVRIPKAERVKPKSVKVQVDSDDSRPMLGTSGS
jgi:HSP20 family protein